MLFRIRYSLIFFVLSPTSSCRYPAITPPNSLYLQEDGDRSGSEYTVLLTAIVALVMYLISFVSSGRCFLLTLSPFLPKELFNSKTRLLFDFFS